MIVEGLIPDARRPGSIRVVVDGRLAWTVPADVIAALDLDVGVAIRGVALERLNRAAEEEGAFRAALRALERRAHAAGELSRKLQRKGHGPQAVADAVSRLRQLELVNDRQFARDFAMVRAERGRGPSRLKYDLLQLGVERGVIDEVLRELDTAVDDPLASPRRLIAKRARQLAGLPRESRRRRLLAYLGRRGYRGADAQALVAEVLQPGATASQ